MPFTPIDKVVRCTQQGVHVSADEAVSMINDLMDLALEEMESNLVQLKAELPSIRSTGQFALPERRQEKKKQAKTAKSDKKGKPGGPLLPIDELSYGDQPQSDNSGSVNGKDRNGSNSPKNLTKTSGKGQHSESPKIWDHSTQATMRYASSPLVDELELYGHLSRKNKKKNNNSGELIEIGSNGTSIPSTPRGESRRKANDEKVSRKRERGEINQLFSPSIANLQVETPPLISPPISRLSTVQSPISAITTSSNESSLARSRCSPSLVSPISSMSLTNSSPFSDDNRRNSGVLGFKDQAIQTQLGSSGGRRQIVPKKLKSRSSVDEKRVVPFSYPPDQQQLSRHRVAVTEQLPTEYKKKSGGGFSVNLNMVVRDPYNDAPYPMHLMVDCPNYEMDKVYVNGMAAVSQNDTGSRRPTVRYDDDRKNALKQY